MMKKIVHEMFKDYRKLSHEEKINHEKNEKQMKKMDDDFEKMKRRNDNWLSKL